MSFSYDTANPTNMHKVRALCGDTIDAGHYLEDGDIDIFLALENNDIRLAAAMACESIAGKLAEKQTSYSLGLEGNVSVSTNPGAKTFLEKAQRLRDAATKNDPFINFSNYDYEINEFGEDVSEYVGDA
jgi:hypothetical protein